MGPFRAPSALHDVFSTDQTRGEHTGFYFGRTGREVRGRPYAAERLIHLRARRVVVATGAYETPLLFPNNDLPGVMLGSAAQRLMHLYGVKPCNRCVVLAGNSDAYAVALDLRGRI